MADELMRTLGGAVGWGIVVLWLWILVLAIGSPLMAFWAMRNIKKMRVEFERLNELLESRLSADARSRL